MITLTSSITARLLIGVYTNNPLQAQGLPNHVGSNKIGELTATPMLEQNDEQICKQQKHQQSNLLFYAYAFAVSMADSDYKS